MSRSTYSEIQADDPQEARRSEGVAFDRMLGLLHGAREAGLDSTLSRDALDVVDRLWTLLLHDLAQPHNALPDTLKAQLISIGLWVMREVADLRLGRSDGFDGLIAINATIRAGLR